jgi:hypothetical protein
MTYRILFILLLLLSQPSCAEALDEQFIGTATMKQDKAIILQLRSEQEDGSIAEGQFEYRIGDAEYKNILEHIGDIKPGETVKVKPWKY